MSESEKPPMSEAKREALRKASEAAAAKRKERGMTEKQRAALERLHESNRLKNEQARRVRQGGEGTAPTGIAQAGPDIDPAPYPEQPKATCRECSADFADDDPKTFGICRACVKAQTEPAPTSEPNADQPTDHDHVSPPKQTTGGIGSWLKKATGL